MNIIKKFWERYIQFNKKAREVSKATSSIETAFKCPKCKSYLYKIVYAKSYDTQYFCKKCNYEGLAKL